MGGDVWPRWVVAVALALSAAGCGAGDTPAEPPAAGTGRPPANPGQAPTDGPDEALGALRQPRPVVVASGYRPEGEPFELTLYGSKQGPCLVLLLPRRGGFGGGACGRGMIRNPIGDIEMLSVSGNGRGHTLEGIVDRRVDSVRVELPTGGSVRANVGRIPRRAARQIGVDPGTGLFVAFVPSAEPLAAVKAYAYDANGDPIATASAASLDY